MNHWIEVLGWALLHFVWQGAVIAATLAAFLGAARRATPTIRYAAACASLAAMVACAAATISVISEKRGDPVEVTTSTTALNGGPEGAGVLDKGLTTTPRDVSFGQVAPQTMELAPSIAATLEGAIPWVVLCWVIGVAVLSARLAGGIALNWRLATRVGDSAPAFCERLLQRLRADLGVRIAVRLVVSASERVPMVIGWLRPVVLLPASALTGLTPEQLEFMLRHELAHIRRHDYLVNLLQCVAEVLLFYHPAAWWVSGQIRMEREHCCDEIAVGGADPVAYVEALAALEWTRSRHVPLALAADGASLVARARRLAAKDLRVGSGVVTLVGRGGAAFLLALLAVMTLAAASYANRLSSHRASDFVAIAAPDSSLEIVPFGTTPCPAHGDLLSLCPALVREAGNAISANGGDGFVVVQDVRTGALIAYAAGGDADREVTTAAPPASIWKLAVAAIWWEQHMPETVDCPASLTVGHRRVRNAGPADFGSVRSPEDMLVHSCNTAAVQMTLRLRAELGAEGVIAALERLGFPRRGTGAAAANNDHEAGQDDTFWAAGPAAWRNRLAPAAVWMDSAESDAGIAELALGTRSVRVTPLHLSRFLQAVGADGVMRRPTLTQGNATLDESVRVMSASTARRLQQAMLATVERGTAVGARSVLAGAQWRLGGKTGTVAGGPGRRENGWFAGLMFDELGAPRYTVVAFVRGAGSGGRGATQVAAGLTRFMGGVGTDVASR